VPKFDLRDIPDVLEVGGMEIRTFLVDHGPTPVVGIRVGGLAYITDVSHIPEKAAGLLRDLDLFIVDAVRLKPHPNHFHLDKALEVVQHLRPKRAILTHLGHDYDHDVSNAKLPQGVELAYDGMRLQIGQ
jgi:phosphoribosyl 1,2-cyclic phosphate phosphodiesterase